MTTERSIPVPYTAGHPRPEPARADLRARIPGWGVDLDVADRPSVPQQQFHPGGPGAHGDLPDQQPETRPRERSIEHQRLTPVFGTAAPLKGVSGVMRRYSYRRYGEGKAAHWLILIAADRVDAVESHLLSFLTLRPDNPITETGVLSEFTHKPLSSRFGRKRADLHHTWMDPIIVGAPWALAAWLVWRSGRAAGKVFSR